MKSSCKISSKREHFSTVNNIKKAKKKKKRY